MHNKADEKKNKEAAVCRRLAKEARCTRAQPAEHHSIVVTATVVRDSSSHPIRPLLASHSPDVSLHPFAVCVCISLAHADKGTVDTTEHTHRGRGTDHNDVQVASSQHAASDPLFLAPPRLVCNTDTSLCGSAC